MLLVFHFGPLKRSFSPRQYFRSSSIILLNSALLFIGERKVIKYFSSLFLSIFTFFHGFEGSESMEIFEPHSEMEG